MTVERTWEPDWRALREAARGPLWYLPVHRELRTIAERTTPLAAEHRDRIKEAVRDLFQELLGRGELEVGGWDPGLDRQREAIDTVVVHHTGRAPGSDRQRIDVIHLLNLYVPAFATLEHLRGHPLSSGHVRDGRTVFFGYHWLVRSDGSAERLLEDEEIGWHAGDWGVNRRSVAICVDGDHRRSAPPETVLAAIGRLIADRYPLVGDGGLLGHGEVNRATDCPGATFRDGWKHDLLRRVALGRR